VAPEMPSRRIEEGPSAVYCGPEYWLVEWRRDLPQGWRVASRKRMTVMAPTNEPSEITHEDWIFELVVWPRK